jgi:protein arginine N-methyltransferase 7
MQLRDDIEQRTTALLAQGPAHLAQRTLNDFNAEAAKRQKAGELTAAIATYNTLFARAKQSNITHPELYVCHSNCAAAYLRLGLYTEALQHANSCQVLAETSIRRCGGPHSHISHTYMGCDQRTFH